MTQSHGSENKLSVLMISDADGKYGAPHSFKQLISEIKRLKGNDIEITVLLANSAKLIQKDLEEVGCKVYLIPFTPFYQSYPYNRMMTPVKYVIRGIEYLYGRTFGVKKANTIVKLGHYDVIHSNSSREDLGAILSKKNNIPHVWHIREFGDSDYQCFSFRKNFVQYINNHSKKCIAISNAVRNHWIKKGISEEKIITIYNGIEAIPFRERETKHRLSCVIMGNLVETKGHKELITALGMLSKDYHNKISVDIIGDGKRKYVNELKNAISYYGLEDIIHFCGYINDSSKLLGKYDVGFMCSRCEAFGRVTVEYMMSGMIVIASDTGANPELIEDGMNGLLYHHGDTKDLCKKIRLIIENPDIINRIGYNAFYTASTKFSIGNTARNIIYLYTDAIKKRKKE